MFCVDICEIFGKNAEQEEVLQPCARLSAIFFRNSGPYP